MSKGRFQALRPAESCFSAQVCYRGFLLKWGDVHMGNTKMPRQMKILFLVVFCPRQILEFRAVKDKYTTVSGKFARASMSTGRNGKPFLMFALEGHSADNEVVCHPSRAWESTVSKLKEGARNSHFWILHGSGG